MLIERFTTKHYPMLLEMLEAQKSDILTHISIETLPEIGYIAIAEEKPIATGFLRQVEGGYGQMDTFVTNPKINSILRHRSLEDIVTALFKDAEKLGLSGTILISGDSSIIQRAKDVGFKTIDQQIMGMNF